MEEESFFSLSSYLSGVPLKIEAKAEHSKQGEELHVPRRKR